MSEVPLYVNWLILGSKLPELCEQTKCSADTGFKRLGVEDSGFMGKGSVVRVPVPSFGCRSTIPLKERCPPRQKSRVELLQAKVEPLLT